MVQAVLFDMDGVLVDSEPAHFAVMRGVLADLGLPVPDERDWEAYFFGRPDCDGLAEWLTLTGASADPEVVLQAKLARFTKRFAELVRPFDDGQWLARALHAAGLPLALVTGARRGEAGLVLDRFDLARCFAVTLTADDVVRGKPDPLPYLTAAERLGTDPARCLVVEDAPAGVRAALAAGARVVIVDRLARPERFDGLPVVTRLDQTVLEEILAAACT